MKNAQRKKIKMSVSFREGYMKPPYPYVSRLRGQNSVKTYIWHPYRSGINNRVKWWMPKYHPECGICKGYGIMYVSSGTLSSSIGTAKCICVTEHSGPFSKKAYRWVS